MKIKYLIIIVAFILAIISIFIIRQIKLDNRPFKDVKFSNSIYVENKTEYSKADTICHVLASKVMEFDTLIIHVGNLVVHSEEMDVDAVTLTHEFDPLRFYIFLSEELSISHLKKVLSHEFIHIEQFLRGDLKYKAPNYFWKGEKIEATEPYNLRPFEKEAFMRDSEILKELNKALY